MAWAGASNSTMQATAMSELGQTEKNSVRAYVFRFALKLGHCSMQSACLKGASNRLGRAAMRSSCRRGACRFSPNMCTSAPVQNLFLSHSHVTEIFFSVKYLLFVCRLIEPKPPGFVMWIATFGNILADGSPRMTQLSVGLDSKRIRLSNDWKAHVLGKAIRSVGGHVP